MARPSLVDKGNMKVRYIAGHNMPSAHTNSGKLAQGAFHHGLTCSAPYMVG